MASRSVPGFSRRCEIALGRSLAACVHPLAAWRSTVRSFRVLLVAGYVAVGYFAVLVVLILMK